LRPLLRALCTARSMPVRRSGMATGVDAVQQEQVDAVRKPW
jgi:hypothetical protein